MNHFRKGEAEELRNYLDTRWSDDIVGCMQGEEDLKAAVRIISDVEQVASGIRDYEHRSSFGRNREEIRGNVINHLRKCRYCYTQYEVAIKEIASGVARVRLKTGLSSIEVINELLEEAIKKADILGLLTEQ